MSNTPNETIADIVEWLRDTRNYRNVQRAAWCHTLADRIEAAALRLVEDLAWDYGTLADWYQHSIDNTVEPVWTDAHLKELSKDFYLIPKIEKEGK